MNPQELVLLRGAIPNWEKHATRVRLNFYRQHWNVNLLCCLQVQNYYDEFLAQ